MRAAQGAQALCQRPRRIVLPSELPQRHCIGQGAAKYARSMYHNL
jgi:hypothetical protein